MIVRKLFVVLLFLATLQTAHAQIAKGTIMAGGNVGFQFTTDNANHGSMIDFSFDPLIGGFIAKNCVLGISPLAKYGQQTGKQGSINTFNSQLVLGLGPFFRYYFKIGDKAYLFVHAAPVTPGAEWDRLYKDNSQPYYRTVMINWAVGPGISVMLAKGIALEVGAYYNGVWHQQNLYQNGNIIGNSKPSYVDHGIVLNVGFQVYFERNKKEKPASSVK